MPSKDSEALKEKIEKLIHIGHNKESMNSFIRLPRTQKRVNFVEKYNKKCKAAGDKKRRENFFKKEDKIMVYLSRKIIPGERVSTE